MGELKGSHIFLSLTLDLDIYHQILIDPTDTDKATFRTHQRQYEFLVIPFGLTNASVTFQETIYEQGF